MDNDQYRELIDNFIEGNRQLEEALKVITSYSSSINKVNAQIRELSDEYSRFEAISNELCGKIGTFSESTKNDTEKMLNEIESLKSSEKQHFDTILDLLSSSDYMTNKTEKDVQDDEGLTEKNDYVDENFESASED